MKSRVQSEREKELEKQAQQDSFFEQKQEEPEVRSDEDFPMVGMNYGRTAMQLLAESSGQSDSIVQKREDSPYKPSVSLELSPPRMPLQRKSNEADKLPNRTGLPDRLKERVENLSGYDLSDVRVNYNSAKAAQLNAHAYTQGQTIEVGPGQERHLPHEAWHVVQQMQGRVRPTIEVRGYGVNDDRGLEREADLMGKRAVQMQTNSIIGQHMGKAVPEAAHDMNNTVQRVRYLWMLQPTGDPEFDAKIENSRDKQEERSRKFWMAQQAEEKKKAVAKKMAAHLGKVSYVTGQKLKDGNHRLTVESIFKEAKKHGYYIRGENAKSMYAKVDSFLHGSIDEKTFAESIVDKLMPSAKIRGREKGREDTEALPEELQEMGYGMMIFGYTDASIKSTLDKIRKKLPKEDESSDEDNKEMMLTEKQEPITRKEYTEAAKSHQLRHPIHT